MVSSTPSSQDSSTEKPPEDIEDGEITDDDEELTPAEPIPTEPTPTPLPITAGAQPTVPIIKKSHGNTSDSDSHGASTRDAKEPTGSDKDRFSDEKERFPEGREKKGRDRESRRGNKDKAGRIEKGHKRMTEAERSILHLRKREKMLREREKWEKQTRKDVEPVDDDFAKTIEKTLATILNKKEKEAAALSGGEEVPVQPKEDKRGKKRKKDDRDKDRAKGKHRRVQDSPRSEIDENEMLNVRSGSPGADMRLHPPGPVYGPNMDHGRSRSLSKSEESFHSDYSSEEREDSRSRRKSNKNRRKKEARDRRREREQRRSNRAEEQPKIQLQDSQGVCVFYMQGKCQKNDCPYSHEVSPPMKLELCKFYLMDCCAKGENCSYMHSEFPCKFYHTGLKCTAGDDCKFAHGTPLSEGLKQILFKHIETAPRDILQGFPRLSRDEALNLINQSQKKLVDQYSSDNGELTRTNPTSFNASSSQSSTSIGPGMYRDESLGEDKKESNEREKEGTKGGIPSLFDISVPVPRELALGLDFELKVPKGNRNRDKQSRWQQEQEAANLAAGFPMKNFSYGTDQDMRINSNGDIDMRTLPAIPTTTPSISINSGTPKKSKISLETDQYNKDVDIRSTNVLPFTKDVDIRQTPMARYTSQSMDTDIRQQLPKSFEEKPQNQTDTEDELHIDTGEEKKDSDSKQGVVENFELPAATRDLLARITANQKDNTIEAQSSLQSQSQSQSSNYDVDVQNINWYSDDDDDDENRLTIKVEEEETSRRERNDSIDSSGTVEKDRASQGMDQSSLESLNSSFLSPPQFNTKTADIVGKLGDLSKIDISAEVTKLLTSMSQNKNLPASEGSRDSPSSSPSSKLEGGYSPKASVPVQDPRIARMDPRSSSQSSLSQEQSVSRQDSRPDPRLTDPRHRSRQGSTDSQEKVKKAEKLSIYEQGGLDMKKAALKIENDEYKGSLRPDVDLRHMALPFKGMQNYTPATEIDATINSHLPMVWKVVVVEIPRPDYTGLKLSINDAEKTGDPRLRKIFRLSVDEKDSPASPKASPKQSGGIRVDPRLRKLEEKSLESQHQLSYSQQLNMLQSSQFYQSLTSNQKLLLNQELARCDQSGGGGMNDPVLNNLLSNLNLLPQAVTSQAPLGSTTHGGDVLSILANITKMNPLMPNQPLVGQQGLLGAAPGIPHIPTSLPQGLSQEFPINFDPRNGGLLGNAPPGTFGPYGGMEQQFGGYNEEYYGYDEPVNMGHPGGNMGHQGGNMGHPGGNMGHQGGGMGPQGGNFRQGRGYNNNNRDGRRRGNRDGFRGGRGNRNFKRGGGRDGRGDRDRDRDGGRGNRGHSPS